MSWLAQPGAISTTSPGRAIVLATCTAWAMTEVSALSRTTTGTSGACFASASATTWRSTPSSTAPRRREPWVWTSSSKVVPLAWPPAIQTIESKARMDEFAACGLVAFESST